MIWKARGRVTTLTKTRTCLGRSGAMSQQCLIGSTWCGSTSHPCRQAGLCGRASTWQLGKWTSRSPSCAIITCNYKVHAPAAVDVRPHLKTENPNDPCATEVKFPCQACSTSPCRHSPGLPHLLPVSRLGNHLFGLVRLSARLVLPIIAIPALRCNSGSGTHPAPVWWEDWQVKNFLRTGTHRSSVSSFVNPTPSFFQYVRRLLFHFLGASLDRKPKDYTLG